jgi:hypothetical protein
VRAGDVIDNAVRVTKVATRARHHGITERRAPSADRMVARDQFAGALVTPRDQVDEQVRGSEFERQVAELVDDARPRVRRIGPVSSDTQPSSAASARSGGFVQLPEDAPGPTVEAVVDRGRRSVDGRTILPASARRQHVDNPAQDPPVVAPLCAWLISW